MATPSSTFDMLGYLSQLASSVQTLTAKVAELELAAAIRVTSSTSVPHPIPQSLGASSRAKGSHRPAADARPTKATIASLDIPFPLAQAHPQEGKADRYACTVIVPDALAGHLVGRGGRGLKQVHDISGARVSAYELKSGSQDERHVSIRGTDQQIGEALVVIGKRLAHKRVHVPKKKELKHPSAAASAPAATVIPPVLDPHRAPPSAAPISLPLLPRIPSPPPPVMPPTSLDSVTVPAQSHMSDMPNSPTVPSVTMASPTPTPSGILTSMEVDRILEGHPNPPWSAARRYVEAQRLSASAPPVRKLQTARRGRG